MCGKGWDEGKLSQAEARQARVNESRYVIKVMKVGGEGSAIPKARENKRMGQAFSLGDNNNTVLLNVK